ncbi:MAG TPA: aminotransferase class V-fold PLP-dependent enzyme [Bacteroidales bacterium]|nr:aminotransferase class V-fold PLP-dependent enzyme [Bacteroidales bacterium]HSA42467.1 aminotransferase class V-fold PLP-dependent enzyme [Bacteroidales bacterium]
MKEHFTLDPGIYFLNHGSFGACPASIQSRQQEYRNMLEKEPVRFMIRDLEEMIVQVKAALAAFLGTDAGSLVLLPNVTHGVNTVLKSIPWKPGDEIVTTNHIYGACRVLLQYLSASAGITFREARVPFPLKEKAQITESILAEFTPRTRLVFVDHVTSPTALIFPVDEIVEECNRRGIDCLVDGAHAPGALPLNLDSLGASWYTGNCHKWMGVPKSAAFLYARPDRRDILQPLAHSHFSSPDRSFAARFHWAGTLDPTPALCIPDAIRWGASLPEGGWEAIRHHNHSLACTARKIICEQLGIPLPCPDTMLTSMAAIPVGFTEKIVSSGLHSFDTLQETLFREYHIEIPVYPWHEKGIRILRLSAQIYNDLSQYEYLARILKKVLTRI